MSTGFETTIRLLSETKNEAAIGALVAGLASGQPMIREASLAAILSRRSTAGHREVLRRLHVLDESSKKMVRRHPGRMMHALRDALLDSDRQLITNGCRAAVWFREYDLIPTLITALEDPANEHADIAGNTLLELTNLLYGELASPRQDERRRDPQMIRHRVVGSLEQSVLRFSKHKRHQVVDSFVLLVKRDNVTLKQVLRNPHHAAFVTLVEVLSKSAAGGAIRLLLSFFDDPHAPTVALTTAAKRTDVRFVQYLLRKIGREPSATVSQNLKQIKSVAWINDGLGILDDLDDVEQHAAVRLVMNSAIPRDGAFRALEHLMKHAKPGGRQAAAEALAEFSGAAANHLALDALDDDDPRVQAKAVMQIRSRGIPGALPRLVRLADSRHAVVRNAVRESLEEFSFSRFLAAFDVLDEEIRRSTGILVKKIDPQTLPLLAAEMKSRVRTRRLRALRVAKSIQAVVPLENIVVGLLNDEDHLVRTEAATALSKGDSQTSLDGLREALLDSSPIVCQAAAGSLQTRGESARQQEALVEAST